MRALASVALLAVLVPNHPVAQAGRETTADDRPIFRLSVSLVQLDAVVTDRKGHHVTTLGPADFEVFQDGRPQPVVAVSYVAADEAWVDTSGLPALPPDALRPKDARRVLALVVDDLRMSFASIYYARTGLQRFAREQFAPGDLAMLVTTSGQSRYEGELTFSRNTLHASISRLHYSLWDVSAASALDPTGRPELIDPFVPFQERTFAASAIQRVSDVIDRLKPLPGRKSVILVSEGFSVGGFGMDNAYIRDAMRVLVDDANRAGVVIYAIDPRGLVVTGMTAADAGGSARQMAETISTRGQALRESQDGLRFVAGETGGFAVINTNDVAYCMKRVMSDQSGYYLIGYQPESGTVARGGRPEFKRVKIKVKRKGLRVRTRSGFYNIPNE
jgi:VWFA-related protein